MRSELDWCYDTGFSRSRAFDNIKLGVLLDWLQGLGMGFAMVLFSSQMVSVGLVVG